MHPLHSCVCVCVTLCLCVCMSLCLCVSMCMRVLEHSQVVWNWSYAQLLLFWQETLLTLLHCIQLYKWKLVNLVTYGEAAHPAVMPMGAPGKQRPTMKICIGELLLTFYIHSHLWWFVVYAAIVETLRFSCNVQWYTYFSVLCSLISVSILVYVTLVHYVQFGGWWAPILVVAALGPVFALVFLIAGCCFCSCRLCGKCEGSSKHKHRNRNNIRCTILYIMLICCISVLW